MDASGDKSVGRRFAWDGFSFLAPANWDLSQYHFGNGVSSLQMEDEVALRLEFEWTRAARAMDPERVRTRYGAMVRKLTEHAIDQEEVEDLPPGWTAFVYTMPGVRPLPPRAAGTEVRLETPTIPTELVHPRREVAGVQTQNENCWGARQLATAYWLAPAGRFFCFARFHLDELVPARAVAIVRQLADSLALHTGVAAPWEVYDLAIALNRDFRLTGTSLEAGRKLLVFQWRLRRLFLWQFSFADIILRQAEPAAWCCEFLNGFKGLHGPAFFPVDGEAMGTRRRGNYPVGHYEEIGRGCFRYQAWCRRLPGKNALALAVYHYRKAADLDKIASLQFS